MTAPVVFADHGKALTTSIAVAECFHKRHDNVIATIRALIAELPAEFTALNFQASEYTDPTGRKLPCYQLTRDGFTLLAMRFTGKRALAWQLRYIEAFNRLEFELKGLADPCTALPDDRRRAALALPETLPDELLDAIRRRAQVCSLEAYDRYHDTLLRLAREGNLSLESVAAFDPEPAGPVLEVVELHLIGLASALQQALADVRWAKTKRGSDE